MPGRPLSPLADAIYSALFTLSRKPDPVVTEAELVKALPPSQQVDRRRRELREALAEIGQACERNDLPRITALVVDEATRLPGSWYFKSAGLGELPDEGRKEAWRREVDRIKKAAYPFELA